MTFIKKRYYIFLICIAIILDASHAFAVDDGLSFDKKIEGKYVIVYYPSGLDLEHLVQQLNISPSDKISVGESLNTKNSYEEELSQMLDTLFLKVSDILEIHLYSLQINLKVFKNSTELSDVYSRLFKSSLGGKSSFYVSELNSIYVSEDGFKPGIIGHEMAHAIICHYFPTPVPIKIQELLAMYTEYSLRRVEK